MAHRRTIRNQKAYDKAERRKEKRRERDIERIAHRIPAIIGRQHDYQLVVHERRQALIELKEGGATGSTQCDEQLLSAALERAIEGGTVVRTRGEYGEFVYEVHRPPQPEPTAMERAEPYFAQYEDGSGLMPWLRRRLVMWSS